jgi:hypothetical protein
MNKHGWVLQCPCDEFSPKRKKLEILRLRPDLETEKNTHIKYLKYKR